MEDGGWWMVDGEEPKGVETTLLEWLSEYCHHIFRVLFGF